MPRAAVFLLCFAGLARSALAAAAVHHPAAADTYTITAVLQIVKPFDVAAMTDDFQDVRVLSQDADTCLFEITYYPLFRPAVGENPNWRQDYAGMTEYLRPTAAENWDEAMRADLLAELHAAGIDPDRLTDKQLVEQVSRWAMRRARSTKAFAIWTVHYPDGHASVYEPLRAAFEKEKPDASWTDQRMIDEEALGRAMFYNKVHGSCTSSSIYLTTIFRALGIPTRTVFCIPPFDANDAAQAEMFYDAIHHHHVRETVRAALDSVKGFANHLFNEVYVGNRWVRLNYSNLGQPILDAHYFGLLTHIDTTADISQVPLAQTWGMRYFRYPAGQAKLSSVNPYRLISVHDSFGPNAHVENPEEHAPELRTATIVKIYRPDTKELPGWVTWTTTPHRGDFLVGFREWVKGVNLPMRAFAKKAGHDFRLTAPGQPELRAHLSGLSLSQGDGSFQAYELQIADDDRAKIVAGAAYTLVPVNTSDDYRWEIAPNLAPFKLKD